MKNIACTRASLLAIALTVFAPAAMAQARCSSDGAPQPTAIFERFISADCEACWSDTKTPAPSATAGTLVLDWIVPGRSADDAPLSAAATNDALVRLQTLGRKPPETTDVHITTVTAPSPSKLRVAHGLPFNDYLGTAIAFTPSRAAQRHNAASNRWSFHLLLVEAAPAGSDGTTVPRHVVRNMLQGSWGPQDSPTQSSLYRWMETRSMRATDSAQVDQLYMVGWVQDTGGRIVAAAQSVCR